MRKLSFLCMVAMHYAFAAPWANYAEFEADAVKALANIDILMSADYTNRLVLCRSELNATNEMASAALLMLAISDDAKSNHVEEFVGNTNCQSRIGWFRDCPATERTLWQKACAVAMLSTGCRSPADALGLFHCATNTLYQWDASENCFSGGALYSSIARYFGASDLSPRGSLVFAAADSAKVAGLFQQFSNYANMLPAESREFLNK